MMLADLGADVTRVVRPGEDSSPDPILRSRHTRTLDLKVPADNARALNLASAADVVIEGMRPGVMERLGIGPAAVAERNPRVIYGRMTGWGQAGPLSPRAGHDINYIAETGALWGIRRPGQPPTPPLNLVGDIGGGSMFLVVGVISALLQRERTGEGAVVDAAIVDGTASLLQTVLGLRATGNWRDEPASNLFDTGRPWYDVYCCADGEYVAVGAVEEKFYAALLAGLGLDKPTTPTRSNPAAWPALRQLFAAAFATRPRDEWVEHFAGIDACVSAVRSITEAPTGPHLAARGTFFRDQGGWSASPAPRLSALPRTTEVTATTAAATTQRTTA